MFVPIQISDLDVLPALPQVSQLGDLAQNEDAEQQTGDLDHREGDRHAADRAERTIEAGDKEVDAWTLPDGMDGGGSNTRKVQTETYARKHVERKCKTGMQRRERIV